MNQQQLYRGSGFYVRWMRGILVYDNSRYPCISYLWAHKVVRCLQESLVHVVLYVVPLPSVQVSGEKESVKIPLLWRLRVELLLLNKMACV